MTYEVKRTTAGRTFNIVTRKFTDGSPSLMGQRKMTTQEAYSYASERILGYLCQAIGTNRIELVEIASAEEMKALIERFSAQSVLSAQPIGVPHD